MRGKALNSDLRGVEEKLSRTKSDRSKAEVRGSFTPTNTTAPFTVLVYTWSSYLVTQLRVGILVVISPEF